MPDELSKQPPRASGRETSPKIFGHMTFWSDFAYNAVMILISTARRWTVLLLCSVLLLLRVGGMHWHLCFDGQEPPVSIHVADSSIEHSAPGVENHHQDQNVDIGLASLIKNGSSDFDLPFIAFTLLLLCAAFARPPLARRRTSELPHIEDLSVLLPPLRGPPSIAIS